MRQTKPEGGPLQEQPRAKESTAAAAATAVATAAAVATVVGRLPTQLAKRACHRLQTRR